MQALILILHVLTAIGLVALILLQQGKGADIGASFGAGTANTMFGSAGAMSFLMKVTAGLAALFFVTSLTLNFIAIKSKPQSTTISAPTSGVEQGNVNQPAESTSPYVPQTESTTTDSNANAASTKQKSQPNN